MEGREVGKVQKKTVGDIQTSAPTEFIERD